MLAFCQVNVLNEYDDDDDEDQDRGLKRYTARGLHVGLLP